MKFTELLSVLTETVSFMCTETQDVWCSFACRQKGHRLRVLYRLWRASVGHDVAVPFFNALESIMEYCVLIAALVVTLIARRQIVYWRTITILGFSTETPIHYISHPHRYSIVAWLIIFVAVAAASFFTDFALWLRTGLFLLPTLVGGFEGQLKAIDKYRSNLREML